MICIYRKELYLTQEQLASALGVTVGAVSKWESGNTVPDITLIIELADLFDTSVDVLLGYSWEKRSMGRTLEKIARSCEEKDFATALREVEKALQRFPNSFDIAYASANAYMKAGIARGSKEECKRTIELYQLSLKLLEQNTDPAIDEIQIYHNMVPAAGNLGGISFGEKQRIDLARFLVKDYDAFIFDEPTSNLDEGTANAVFETILALQDKMIVVITHTLRKEILERFDEVIRL